MNTYTTAQSAFVFWWEMSSSFCCEEDKCSTSFVWLETFVLLLYVPLWMYTPDKGGTHCRITHQLNTKIVPYMLWSWNVSHCSYFTLFLQLLDTFNNSSFYMMREEMLSLFSWQFWRWAWILLKKQRITLDHMAQLSLMRYCFGTTAVLIETLEVLLGSPFKASCRQLTLRPVWCILHSLLFVSFLSAHCCPHIKGGKCSGWKGVCKVPGEERRVRARLWWYSTPTPPQPQTCFSMQEHLTVWTHSVPVTW